MKRVGAFVLVVMAIAMSLGPSVAHAGARRLSPLWSSALGATGATIFHMGLAIALTKRTPVSTTSDGPVVIDEYGNKLQLSAPTMQTSFSRAATANYALASLHAGLALVFYTFARLERLAHPHTAMVRVGRHVVTAQRSGLSWQARF